MDSKYDFDVIVVGAGVSGLQCATELKQNGFNVLVVEADTSIGGRVKTIKKQSKPIDLGAEFIHGECTRLYKYISKFGWSIKRVMTWAQGDGDCQPIDPNGSFFCGYYMGNEKKFYRFDTQDKDIVKINQTLSRLCEIPLDLIQNDKRTLRQFLKDEGNNERALSLADAGYGHTLCSNIDEIKFQEAVKIERSWLSDGEYDFRLDDGMGLVVNQLSKDLNIKVNWPASSIQYLQNSAKVFSKNGESFSTRAVVITASPPAINKNISFAPALPESKQNAIKSIKLENAMKIILFFNKRIWPKDLQAIIFSDSVVPEIYFERRGVKIDSKGNPIFSDNDSDDSEFYTANAFATSHFAEKLYQIPEEQIVDKIISLLNEVFNTNCRENLANHFIYSWKNNPYVLGGYSSPATTEELRKQLFEPVGNSLFFAGEATNHNSYMTVHGAMESGIKSANIVSQVLGVTSKL